MLPQQYQAKQPVTVLAGTYGHPLHPILVTVPIGAWVTSLVFDIASHAVHPAGFLARGSLWLIGVGVIGAVLAACFGVLDLSVAALVMFGFAASGRELRRFNEIAVGLVLLTAALICQFTSITHTHIGR